MDYALFHDEKNAKDYLACRFARALKSYGLEEADTGKVKKKDFSFMLEGYAGNCYGKIKKIKLN